jgi:hypothetical protein
MKRKLLTLLVLVASSAACSGVDRTHPPGGGGGGEDGGARVDSAVPRVADAGDPTPKPDLAGVYQVVCGAQTCDLTADQICCFPAGSTTPSCSAIGDCAFFGHMLKCDGPEDCAGTKICCGTVDTYTSGACVPGAACPGALVRLCRSPAQCPAATPHCCSSQSAYAYSCLANPPANYDCLGE